MIDITKKYQTRDGDPVEFITDKGRGEYPIIGYIGDNDTVDVWTQDGKFSPSLDHARDLIEVSPYADWKIDDKILVSNDRDIWVKKHFAGLDCDGLPMSWKYGVTSWSATPKARISWMYAKKPKRIKESK
jgi:hypothetical protein